MNFSYYVNQSLPNWMHWDYWTVYPTDTGWDWLSRHGIGFWTLSIFVLILLFAISGAMER